MPADTPAPAQENISTTAWCKTADGVPKAKAEMLGYMMDEADAEVDDGTECPFPAQCSFEIVEEMAPMPEAEFKHVLEYTERQRFKFKLSRWQCKDLVELMCHNEAKKRGRRLLNTFKLEA
jgi:hypothetical protein